jgi:hypothetical protein
MQIRYPVLLVVLLTFSACNITPTNDKDKNKDSTDAQRGAAENPASIPGDDISGCYMRVTGRDTLIARLQLLGDSITGSLLFDNYEKDGSSGMVSGKLYKGIIKLVYSFRSEGMNSVMDVWFKKQGDALIRGIGDMQTKGDTAYFTNTAVVDFPAGEKLSKIPCDLPDKKLPL